MAQTQKPRRVPSSSSINTAGQFLASDAITGQNHLRPVDGPASRDILSGLPGYRQERERAASRMTDRTTISDKGKERHVGDRPESALSTHSRPEQRRNRDAERETRGGEGGRRTYGTSDKASTPSEVPSEAERPRVRDKDRLPGLGRREREREVDTGKPKENGRIQERHVARDREGHRERGTHRTASSAPETPVTEDDASAARRETVRPGDPLRPENFRKESDTRDLLREVPLAVQEAWICEDLGYVLQVRTSAWMLFESH